MIEARNPFNTGIYSVPDAARLTGISAGRIRRWMRGYRYRSHEKQYHSPPLWQGQLQPIDGSLALGFRDLIEIKFVDAFLESGVSWAMLRKVHERAAKMFPGGQPFCTNRFATDGRDIFAELHDKTGGSSLVEIARDQKVFAAVTRPFLKELEFGADDRIVLWRPLTSRQLVVLDPTRNFGRPIVARQGVPTEVLARAASACGSTKEVSQWYEVPWEEVEDAVEFERKLAAA